MIELKVMNIHQAFETCSQMPFRKGTSRSLYFREKYGMLSGRKPSFLPLLESLSYGWAEGELASLLCEGDSK